MHGCSGCVKRERKARRCSAHEVDDSSMTHAPPQSTMKMLRAIEQAKSLGIPVRPRTIGDPPPPTTPHHTSLDSRLKARASGVADYFTVPEVKEVTAIGVEDDPLEDGLARKSILPRIAMFESFSDKANASLAPRKSELSSNSTQMTCSSTTSTTTDGNKDATDIELSAAVDDKDSPSDVTSLSRLSNHFLDPATQALRAQVTGLQQDALEASARGDDVTALSFLHQSLLLEPDNDISRTLHRRFTHVISERRSTLGGTTEKPSIDKCDSSQTAKMSSPGSLSMRVNAILMRESG